MSLPAARLTDMHACPMVTGLVPHVGGPIVAPGMPTVLIGSLPSARVTDICVCAGPPDPIVTGSPTVLVGSLPAARITDSTAHGGVITTGCPTVLIGASSSSGGGAGGGGSGGGAGTGFDELLSTAPALAAPLAQARALVQAAKSGIPFCERCTPGR